MKCPIQDTTPVDLTYTTFAKGYKLLLGIHVVSDRKYGVQFEVRTWLDGGGGPQEHPWKLITQYAVALEKQTLQD